MVNRARNKIATKRVKKRKILNLLSGIWKYKDHHANYGTLFNYLQKSCKFIQQFTLMQIDRRAKSLQDSPLSRCMGQTLTGVRRGGSSQTKARITTCSSR